MRGIRLLIACVTLVASAQFAQAGLMVGISGVTGSRDITVTLSGSATVKQLSGVNVFSFARFPLGSQTITFAPVENFGSLSLSSTSQLYEIEKLVMTANTFEFITKDLITAPANATLTLPGNSTNVALQLNQDINNLGVGSFSLTDTAHFNVTSSLTVTARTGNPPQVVPEPSSLAIFGIGALGMAGMGMRRERRENATA